jgi:uncharacterized membrane protein YedE/YeeE
MTFSWGAAIASTLAVGLMGFAIQRGGTCTVAAIDEIVSQRRAHRLAAMGEASLWVVGGLALAQLAHVAGSMPAGHAVTLLTIAGGVLLGLGAWVNGACVFGAIARLGSGQWAQAFTPVGFFVGCLGVAAALPHAPNAAPAAVPLWHAGAWLGPLFVGYALWRVGPSVLAVLRRPTDARRSAACVWAPHAATIVIGVTFVVTLLLAGPWAYTDVLARSAQGLHDGMAAGDWNALALPLVLFAALYIGALVGGWSAGRWRHTAPTRSGLLRALLGGALMGCGSVLIPGSNDGLILIGIPLLMPHAWLAFASMGLAIAAALLVQRAWPTHTQASDRRSAR